MKKEEAKYFKSSNTLNKKLNAFFYGILFSLKNKQIDLVL